MTPPVPFARASAAGLDGPRRLRLAAVLLVAALATLVPLRQARAADACNNCGTIASVAPYRVEQQVTSIGAISGVATMDSPTSQPGRTTTQFAIGRGFSNEGMVVLGAAGGAGYARTPSNAPQTRWEIVVRMDDGNRRSLTQGYEPRFLPGDRVRVFGTQLEPIQD